jgi:hypothetical protein
VGYGPFVLSAIPRTFIGLNWCALGQDWIKLVCAVALLAV